jgi:cytoskeleton protein RodZ
MIKLTQMPVDNDGSGEKDGQGRRRIHLREISGGSETPLETVGQNLRAARLRRGDEIAQVSRALKIRKDHLEALEEDRLEDLPGKTYAIGFVRSYARHLGLDADQYVERFKQEISGRTEEHSREPAPIHQEEGRHYLPHGWRIIAGVVILLLGYGVWHLMAPSGDAGQQVPPAPVLNPPKPKPKPAPMPVVAPAQTATPSPAADAVPPPVAAMQGQQASATPPPAAGAKTPATSTAQMAAPPGAQAGASQASASLAAVPPASAAPGQIFGGVNANSRVVIRARSVARVTVKGSDGSVLLNRNLQPGDSYHAPDDPGVSMATNDAGALEVDLDGVSLGRVGQPQQVLGRVSLDPQSLSDRFGSR